MDCEGIAKAWLAAAFEAVAPGCGAGKVVPSKDARFGDWQCNDAMGVAKRAGKNPRELAQAVVDALPLPEAIEKAEVAGPGFINLTLSGRAIAAGVAALAEGKALGVPQVGADIGHIRSTVIGNAIDRILRALGYAVIADNHLGDWGTQFGILIMGYRTFLTDEERANLTVELLEQVYVKSYNATKEDPAWLERCRAELVRLQDPCLIYLPQSVCLRNKESQIDFPARFISNYEVNPKQIADLLVEQLLKHLQPDQPATETAWIFPEKSNSNLIKKDKENNR